MFTVNPIVLKKAILSSLWKALLVALLFLLLGLFQNKNIVREYLEDYGFDGSKYNFIEHAAKDLAALKAQFDSQSLIFVSPNFHQGNDDVVRRNEPVKVIGGKPYPNAAIALWQIIKHGNVDLAQAHEFINDVKQAEAAEKDTQKRSHRVNVNANRIWMRNYNYPHQTNPTKQPCGVNSYWDNLKKYSLSCSFKGMVPSPVFRCFLCFD